MDNEYYNHTNYEYNPDSYEPQDHQTQEPEKKPEKKKSGTTKWLVCIAMAVVFGLVASATFVASAYVMNGTSLWTNLTLNQKNNEIEKAQTTTSTNSTVDSDIANVAESVMPSVVSITNSSVQQVQDWIFGQFYQQEQQSSGSGIIISQKDTELLIVTNNHVVENSKTLTVTFIDETSVEATIKGTDSNMDLAIISVSLADIKEETQKQIKVATLGNSTALRVGEPTIAIGNALGYGQSVTTGIVSALNREIEGFDSKLIQTDAAINPGNSGGALLNANGEVIGINTVKVSADAVEGMGYAIPISDVSEILDELMNRQTRTKVAESQRGALGIEGTTVDESTAEVYSVPEGVFISKVTEGSAAEKAGLKKGTVIIKLDGTSVDTIEELQEELQYYSYGETVTLTVAVPQSDGEYKEEEVKVTLQKK